MILAGIDEAGYGPLLGPLTVGCCAFEIPDGEGADLPCLWKLLRRVAGKSRSKNGRKLHINDSKLVYSPAAGLKELERSILALAGTGGESYATLEAFLARVAADVLAELPEYRWYVARPEERFPIEQDAVAVRLLSHAVSAEMQRVGVRLAHLAARVVPERHLNRMFDATRNKSSTLFSLAAIHLDFLLRNFASQRLVIFCDRQGGREHYGHLLRLMFEDWALAVVQEDDGACEYRLARGGHDVRLIFREKAESQCMSVAVASMLCKYLREALMRRFNGWWREMLPGVAPTAGYYSDGVRFLRDIAAKREELGIADDELVRAR